MRDLRNYFIQRHTILIYYHFEFINLSYPNVLLTLDSHAKNHMQNMVLLNEVLNIECPKLVEFLQLVILLIVWLTG